MAGRAALSEASTASLKYYDGEGIFKWTNRALFETLQKLRAINFPVYLNISTNYVSYHISKQQENHRFARNLALVAKRWVFRPCNKIFVSFKILPEPLNGFSEILLKILHHISQSFIRA